MTVQYDLRVENTPKTDQDRLAAEVGIVKRPINWKDPLMIKFAKSAVQSLVQVEP